MKLHCQGFWELQRILVSQLLHADGVVMFGKSVEGHKNVENTSCGITKTNRWKTKVIGKCYSDGKQLYIFFNTQSDVFSRFDVTFNNVQFWKRNTKPFHEHFYTNKAF